MDDGGDGEERSSRWVSIKVDCSAPEYDDGRRYWNAGRDSEGPGKTGKGLALESD